MRYLSPPTVRVALALRPHPAVGAWFLLVASPAFGSEHARTAFLTVILWPACHLRIMGSDRWLFLLLGVVVAGVGRAFVRAKAGFRKKHILVSEPNILKPREWGTLRPCD